MSIKKLSFMLLSALSLAALLNGCGSSSKEGTSNLGGVAKADEATCRVCHSTTLDPESKTALLAEYFGSAHNDEVAAGCQGCHGGGAQHNGSGPLPFPDPIASNRCVECHDIDKLPTVTADFVGKCAGCHTASRTGGVHAAKATTAGDNCIGCHDVAAPQHGAKLVGDNDGVRAITTEFAKRSHHVTGRTVKNSDCAVCHLEGKKSGTAVVIDTNFHMKDDKIYLRNGNITLVGNQTTAVGAGYPWQPSAPNHTLMDEFCFSCHNTAGAPAAATALAGVTGYTGTALNPFGDSVSNDYDQVSRVNVVGVYEQFDTKNSSHHAVRGKMYKSKFLTTAQFQNISSLNAGFVENGVNKPIGNLKALDISGNKLVGTMYETGKFVSTYTTLNGEALADDNTLHCGDCHTVGQFRKADVNTAAGSFNKLAIGAHGSNNEYMLRNSNGDDTFAKDALVCFMCHKEQFYNSDTASGGDGYTGPIIPGAIKHNTANSGWDCNGTILNSAGKTGLARLQLAETEDANADGTLGPLGLAAYQKIVNGKYGATSGSPIFGYSCAGCHNSSDKKTFGGIHGNAGNATYTTYSGAKLAGMNASTPVQRLPYRFMPGLGNFRYNGGDNADAWSVKTVSTANKQGCYTLNGTSARGGANNPAPTKADLSGANVQSTPAVSDGGVLGSWGACTDHAGTSVAGGRAVTRTILRPLTY